MVLIGGSAIGAVLGWVMGSAWPPADLGSAAGVLVAMAASIAIVDAVGGASAAIAFVVVFGMTLLLRRAIGAVVGTREGTWWS